VSAIRGANTGRSNKDEEVHPPEELSRECLIRPKRIYFPEHVCYCFFSNLYVLNTTNTDSRCFQQNCSGVLFLCRNPTFRKNPGKYCKNSIFARRPAEPEGETKGGSGLGSPPGGAAQAWPHPPVVRPPRPSHRPLLPPTYTL
jgi:hypothetical protein